MPSGRELQLTTLIQDTPARQVVSQKTLSWFMRDCRSLSAHIASAASSWYFAGSSTESVHRVLHPDKPLKRDYLNMNRKKDAWNCYETGKSIKTWGEVGTVEEWRDIPSWRHNPGIAVECCTAIPVGCSYLKESHCQ